MLTPLRAAVLLLAAALPARAGGPAESPAAASERPWPVALGIRVEGVERAFPLVDRVVVVPDAATYLDELARWSPRGRWPVLLEDDHLAPMFIRRFRPATVLRRDSVGAPAPTETALEAIVVRAWGGDPARHAWRDVFEAPGHVPPGIVVAATGAPAWAAAVALAAGRGQPLAWLDADLGAVDHEMAPETVGELRARVDALVADTGYPADGLGDAIETITLCRNMATKGLVRDGGRLDPRAITDLVGRRADGRRYAVTGLVFGDERRAAYAAMCALFLPRTEILLYDAYAGGKPPYDVDALAPALRERGYEVQAHGGSRVSAPAWRRLVRGGIRADLVHVNSSGEYHRFRVAPDVHLTANAVPLLDVPAAVHFIHSFSMQVPTRAADSVGGRWWAHGAYAYVGSVHEPMLGAFVPPGPLLDRLSAYVPLLVAARHWQDVAPFGTAWKVNTFGDPLMLCPPPRPGAIPRPRVEPPPDDEPRGTDLAARARALLAAIAEDPDGPDGPRLAEAIRTLALVGRDDLVVRTWQYARQHDLAAAAARPALGALYRAGDAEAFMQAWDELPLRGRDARALDMIWHLLDPRLGGAMPDDWLLALQSSVRQPLSHEDAARLAPHLARRFGGPHARRFIEHLRTRSTREDVTERLERLLAEY